LKPGNKAARNSAYETLNYDGMNGDATLFPARRQWSRFWSRAARRRPSCARFAAAATKYIQPIGEFFWFVDRAAAEAQHQT
jgi:glucose-6-phosphate 1-dehydrogenase